MLLGKSHNCRRQPLTSSLIGALVAAQIRCHIGEYEVDNLPIQRLGDFAHHLRLLKIALDELHLVYDWHRQQIAGNDVSITIIDASYLRPTTRSATQIYDHSCWLEQVMLGVELL